ncbi:hypothetical protein AVEN_68330-1 [Araneus ventricosus]|uniref:Uncharacterized protein n=1 Tax=Araneus ventricosus TaxID=182803 RepID=A0A4Y2GIT1_ARAVE|nr:hypothetical protein AVEN_68330-1 [Araneus ventricosus]
MSNHANPESTKIWVFSAICSRKQLPQVFLKNGILSYAYINNFQIAFLAVVAARSERDVQPLAVCGVVPLIPFSWHMLISKYQEDLDQPSRFMHPSFGTGFITSIPPFETFLSMQRVPLET